MSVLVRCIHCAVAQPVFIFKVIVLNSSVLSGCTEMEAKKQELRLSKRPYSSELESNKRPNKRPLTQCVKIEDGNGVGAEKIFKFRVLCPNGMSLGLKIRDPGLECSIDEFVELVKGEYFRALRQKESEKPKRRIDWKCEDLHFVDAFDNVMRRLISFKNFKPNKYHILRLHVSLCYTYVCGLGNVWVTVTILGSNGMVISWISNGMINHQK